MSKTAVTGALLSVALDRTATEPLYRQLLEQIREAIESGRLPAGTKLPSTRVLADEFAVSRNTVLQVFETLANEGILRGHVGAGTYVAASNPTTAPVRDTERREPADPGHYPFRSLSRRGRTLIASAICDFAERPLSFMPDVPDLREFPIKTWLRLFGETSGHLTGRILADASNAGYEPLRRAVAQHLNSARGMSCDYSQVIITTGSQQSLDLTCRMLVDPGDPVWLEEPGYVGARSVIRGNGGDLWPVPVDEAGMQLELAQANLPVPRLIFTSPSRQYPLGPTLSTARRERLLELSRSSGAWIVEDDYDNEFRFAGSNLRSIYGMDGNARTIHIGTFSKILLPSFRLGYMVVPRDLSSAFASARAIVDRHASLIEQMVLSEFMVRGLFASHVRRMRVLYRARQRYLIDGLEALLGYPLRLANTETGMHLTLMLDREVDDINLASRIAEHGVIVRPLTPYYATRAQRPGLLLGFAAFRKAEIDSGLERLASFVEELRRCIVVPPGPAGNETRC